MTRKIKKCRKCNKTNYDGHHGLCGKCWGERKDLKFEQEENRRNNIKKTNS